MEAGRFYFPGSSIGHHRFIHIRPPGSALVMVLTTIFLDVLAKDPLP